MIWTGSQDLLTEIFDSIWRAMSYYSGRYESQTFWRASHTADGLSNEQDTSGFTFEESCPDTVACKETALHATSAPIKIWNSRKNAETPPPPSPVLLTSNLWANSQHKHLKHYHKYFCLHIYPGRGPVPRCLSRKQTGNTSGVLKLYLNISCWFCTDPHLSPNPQRLFLKIYLSLAACWRPLLMLLLLLLLPLLLLWNGLKATLTQTTRWRSSLTASPANPLRQLRDDIRNESLLMQIECIC